VSKIELYRPVGEVKHRGLELEALGQINPAWQINASYAYLDAKITGAVAGDKPLTATIGQRELYLPKQTVGVYTTYTVQSGIVHGFSFGGGVRFVDRERTSYDTALANTQARLSPTKDIPGYTVIDANIGYTRDQWLVQLNARNIFDRHYFVNGYQSLVFGNVYGQPANVALSVRRQF
jgi:iron complex outermembrane receptor protein